MANDKFYNCVNFLANYFRTWNNIYNEEVQNHEWRKIYGQKDHYYDCQRIWQRRP